MEQGMFQQVHVHPQLLSRVAARLQNGVTLFDIACHRLLQQDMLTRLQGGTRMLRVQVVRRGDHHRVNIVFESSHQLGRCTFRAKLRRGQLCVLQVGVHGRTMIRLFGIPR